MRLSARDLSLRTKLVGGIALLLAAVAIAAAVFFPSRMATLSHGWAERRAVGMTSVLASAAAAGLEFDDVTNVKELLERLSSSPGVEYAEVRRADGSLFAAWHPELRADVGIQAGPEVTVVEHANRLHVASRITGKGGTSGSIVVGFSLAELEQEKSDQRRLVATVSVIVFILALVVSFVIGTIVVRPLGRMTELALRVASGDLSDPEMAQLGDDEVGRMAEAFDRMLRSQRDVLQQISETSVHLAGAASEMYAASQQQEAAATRQSSGVEEVSRTMDSLLASAAHIAESARGVLANAERTRETADMTASKILELNGHTSRIGELLEVIRDIADRSDLLALNASIEATRAGEAGRAFSLVAAEIRRLAERVTASVQDVKALVADVRSSGSSTVMATEEGRKLAESTTTSAREITMVTQQQRTGTEQVSQSMRDISSVLTQSVTSSQQTRALAEELKNHADRLADVVGRFRVNGAASSSIRTLAREPEARERAA